MEKLNHQSFNVSVLDYEDLKTRNGGFWGAAIFFVISTLTVAAIDSPEDFWEGYESVRK
jgi:hypothetical protein